MEKKQTAVAWIISKIALRDNSPFQAIAFYNDNKELIEQAKAMEKEQLIEFFMIGQDIGTCIEDAEETYNEIYGNANK